MIKAHYDVAIVGAGPVGAVAACLLGQAGIQTVIIDKSDAIYDKSRAVALDHEILRVFQGLGLGEKIAPYCEPFTDSHYYGVDGQLIKQLTMAAEPYQHAWTPSNVFMQPAVERILRERLASLETVETRYNQAVTGFLQSESHVTLSLSHDTVTARYVIGCDGATSTLRKAAGLALEDLGFDQSWLVVDILANEKGLAKLPNFSVQYCEPSRPTTFVKCTGNHRRFEISLNECEDPRLMETPAETWKLLSRWITPQDAELWRSSSYRFHALVAKNWRNNRVFIAGDAAHQQPPFLGQGLCQGIRDVANLTWKLERVIKGLSGDVLLDTYGVERASHVKKLTGIIKHIGLLIGERDVNRAILRDKDLISQAGGTIKPTPRQDLMPSLDCGLISTVDHSACGRLFPQAWTKAHKRQDDVFGGGVRLVTLSKNREVEVTAKLLNAKIISLTEINERDGVLREWFATHNAIAALIRPDNYVFGAARDLAELHEMAREFNHALDNSQRLDLATKRL